MHRYDESSWPFTVVCFYTERTPYEQESEGLERTCREFKIPCVRRGYQNRRSWVRNAGLKPEFLLDMLEELDTDLLYVDADARIRQSPDWLKAFNGDLGIRHRWGREVLSGTIYLRNNQRVNDLVRVWVQKQFEQPDQWDQRILQRILASWKLPLDVVELPATYCQIFDGKENKKPAVIEHLQASRRFKRIIEHEMVGIQIPHKISKSRIRRHNSDGSIWIVRRDRVAEKWLDEHCIRIPGSLRWVPRFIVDNRISNLIHYFKNKNCYIVGKGPSLDLLTEAYFEDEDLPIICLNESIFAVEKLDIKNPIFCLQQDASLRNRCQPSKSPIFVSTKAANYYANYEHAYIFENTSMGLSRNALSVTAAIAISRQLGTVGYKLLCFDACVNKKLTYAKCIGYDATWGGKLERFLSHKNKILSQIKGRPTTWIIPGDPAIVTYDNIRQ